MYSHQSVPGRAHHLLRSFRQELSLLVIAVVLAVATLVTAPVLAQTSSCQLGPVFAMLRDSVGRDRVGECTGPATRADSGDITQATTRGTLTLRASDLVVMFNDGQTTWLYGPRGLESRLTTARLPWETGGDARVAATGDPNSMIRSGAPSTTASGPVTGSVPGPVTGSVDGSGVASVAASTTVPSPVPTSQPVDQTVKLSGSSAQTTESFDLAGGDYNVAWEARLQSGNSSCYVGSRLRRVENQNPGSLVLHTNMNNTHDRSADGQTRLFNVAPGRYVLDVATTGCDWSFEISPSR